VNVLRVYVYKIFLLYVHLCNEYIGKRMYTYTDVLLYYGGIAFQYKDGSYAVLTRAFLLNI
jgi:hypothetical protein